MKKKRSLVCRHTISLSNTVNIYLFIYTNIFVFYFLQSEEELIEVKNKRKASSSITGNKILPYIKFVGNIEKEGDENESEIETKITINDFDFKIKSNKIVEAISYCFKAIFCLNLDFPSECKHVWTFLQQYVYEIELNAFKPYTAVNKLIEELKTLKSENNAKQSADSINLHEL